MKRAFTLIELLIVVAIIAILAAIALPNFLEAQTRAKISRTAADLRTMATAIDTYALDWNRHPMDGAVLQNYTTVFPTGNPSDAANRTKFAGPSLTTPVAYLVNQPQDPFNCWEPQQEFRWYFYANLRQASGWLQNNMGAVPPVIQVRINTWGGWMMLASGPDQDRLDVGASAGLDYVNGYYDPTNGTLSNGDIVIAQKIRNVLK